MDWEKDENEHREEMDISRAGSEREKEKQEQAKKEVLEAIKNSDSYLLIAVENVGLDECKTHVVSMVGVCPDIPLEESSARLIVEAFRGWMHKFKEAYEQSKEQKGDSNGLDGK